MRASGAYPGGALVARDARRRRFDTRVMYMDSYPKVRGESGEMVVASMRLPTHIHLPTYLPIYLPTDLSMFILSMFILSMVCLMIR